MSLALPIQATAQQAPAMRMTTEIPAEILTPPTVETSIGTLRFFDGIPDDATTQLLYDDLDLMRGVEAFLSAMPVASTEAVRIGLASQGGDNNQSAIIFESLMDSKSLFPTPNTESVYSIMWLDTTDGPLVLETPPNVLGVIDDHCRARPGPGRQISAATSRLRRQRARRLSRLALRNLRQPVLLARLPRERKHGDSRGNTKNWTRVYRLADAANPPPMTFICDVHAPVLAHASGAGRHLDVAEADTSHRLRRLRKRFLRRAAGSRYSGAGRHASIVKYSLDLHYYL